MNNNPFQSPFQNRLLKDAIFGYVSYQMYLREQMLKRYMRARIIIASVKVFVVRLFVNQSVTQKRDMPMYLKDTLHCINRLQLVLQQEIGTLSQEEKIRAIFRQHGIDLNFLKKDDVLEFAKFVVDLSKHLKHKRQAEQLPQDDEKAYIQQEAVYLIRQRYMHLEYITGYLPVFIQQVGGEGRLHHIAYELRSVVVAERTMVIKASNVAMGLEDGGRSPVPEQPSILN